jgi:hypothetical protein
MISLGNSMKITRWTRLAAAALVLGLTACAGDGSGSSNSTTAAATGDSWQNFRVPGGDFAVSLPEAPKPGRDTTAKDGSVNKSYYVEESRCVYMVGYSSSPPWKGSSLDGRLDSTRDALSKRLGGKLRRERRFALGDSRAMEFVLDVPASATSDGYTIRGRIYVKHAPAGKDLLYQTLVTGKPGIDRAAETTRFLESFRFFG